MVLNDQYQLRKIRKGDITSFEMLFHRFYPGLTRYAGSLVHKGEVAEELVQDVFYNLWKNRDTLRITSSWQRYLYRSVYNNSMMYLRKSRREHPMDEQLSYHLEIDPEDPSGILQGEELAERISRSLEELPERTREIFQLNRLEGLKYKDIAERLSISVKTVEAHMGKALSALRTSLQKYEQE
jgi:RNA polymerase sigma-70 factor (ECF subfamily)